MGSAIAKQPPVYQAALFLFLFFFVLRIIFFSGRVKIMGSVLPSTPFVRVLVSWAKGKRFTNRLPNLSLKSVGCNTLLYSRVFKIKWLRKRQVRHISPVPCAHRRSFAARTNPLLLAFLADILGFHTKKGGGFPRATHPWFGLLLLLLLLLPAVSRANTLSIGPLLCFGLLTYVLNPLGDRREEGGGYSIGEMPSISCMAVVV